MDTYGPDWERWVVGRDGCAQGACGTLGPVLPDTDPLRICAPCRMLQKTREIGARPRAPPKARRERPLRREDADALAELDRFTPPRGRPSIASKSKRSQRQPISRQVRPAAPEDSQHVPAT